MPFVVSILVLRYKALVGMDLDSLLEKKEEKWDTCCTSSRLVFIYNFVLVFEVEERAITLYRKGGFFFVTLGHAALSYKLHSHPTVYSTLTLSVSQQHFCSYLCSCFLVTHIIFLVIVHHTSCHDFFWATPAFWVDNKGTS